MSHLQFERRGGFGGFGGPHLKSRGELALADLSPADRRAIDDLFRDPQKAKPTHPGEADAFCYRITRPTAAGPQTIYVPETAVPVVVRRSAKDVIE
jgi:hypothetical protein